MPKKGLHFAVRDGRNPGIYSTWEECKAQIIGVETAKWKRFHILQEAEEYILQCGHIFNDNEGSSSKPISLTDSTPSTSTPASSTPSHSSSTPASSPKKRCVLDTNDISSIIPSPKVACVSEDADTTITNCTVVEVPDHDNQLFEKGPSLFEKGPSLFEKGPSLPHITIGNNFQQNNQPKSKFREAVQQLPEHRFVQENSSSSSDDEIEIIENPLKSYHMNQSTSEEFYKSGTNEEEVAVGIFWDIENVRMPKGVNPTVFISKVRKEFVDSSPKFCEKHFYVVCDVTAESNNIMKQLFEFHVRIVHVPRLKANSSDNVIRDLMHEFVGYNKFSRIILISGDSDFSHDIHNFRRNKKCDCILIHNQNAKPSMVHSASTAYLYTDLIYDRVNDIEQQPTSSRNEMKSYATSSQKGRYVLTKSGNGPEPDFVPLSEEALSRAYYRKKRRELLTPRNKRSKRRFFGSKNNMSLRDY